MGGKMSEWQRGVLALLGLAVVAAVAWGFMPAGGRPAASAAPVAETPLPSIAKPGDPAITKGKLGTGCAGFDSEDAQEQAGRAAMAGDKGGFADIARAHGRHMNQDERVRVTGYGEKTGHRRVEDAEGKGWWVDFECLTNAP